MDIVPYNCYKEILKAIGLQDRSVQLDFAIQHLDWLEKYSENSGAVRKLASHIINSFSENSSSPFFNDPRIFKVFLTVGRVSRNLGFKGVMKQLSDRGQFARVADFYIHWAEVYASENDSAEFEKIFNLAVERNAEPQEMIKIAFREMKLKYFGASDDTVEDNTEMLMVSRSSLDAHKGNKENIVSRSPLALGVASFTHDFYSKAMQDFSNTLPVAVSRGNAPSRGDSDASGDVTITAQTGEVPKFEVYVDEEINLEQVPEIPQKKSRTAGDAFSTNPEQNYCRAGYAVQVGSSTMSKDDCGNVGLPKKPECSRNCGSSSIYSNVAEALNKQKKVQNSTSKSLSSKVSSVVSNQDCHFLDPISEEMVAGTFVKQKRAGIAASTPANPLVPSIEEHMIDFSMDQEEFDDSDIVSSTSKRVMTSGQSSAEGDSPNVVGLKNRPESVKSKSSGGTSVRAVSGLTKGREEKEEPTGQGLKSSITSDVNPWNDELRRKIMLKHCLYPTYLHDCQKYMERFAPGMSRTFEGEKFKIMDLIGQGRFAKVFRCKSEDGNIYAIKMESPPCRWEVYVCELLRLRLPSWAMAGVMTVHDAYIYKNMSVIAYDYHQYGSLQTLADSLKLVRKTCSGLLCVYLGWQMAWIIREVHKARIIHADVKPDNFLILRKLNKDSTLEELLDNRCFTLKLIDWGRAIDMSASDLEGRAFSGKAGTEHFDCLEMMDGRPWTYQADFYGFIATLHVLLFGTYMQSLWKEDSKKYQMVSVIKRRCNQRDMLQDIFEACLNIEDCEHLPSWSNIINGFAESVMYSLRNDPVEWETSVQDFNDVIRLRCEKS